VTADTAVELLWGERPPPSRGPARSVTLERLAAATVAIADTEGLETVSMQRVAADLGLTKMALYRYVSSKSELLALTIEAAVGPAPDLSGVTGGWRRCIEEWARLLHATWLAHPWLPGATVGERVMGPQEVAWIESAMGALAGTGLPGPQRMDVILLLAAHTRASTSTASTGTQPWTSDHLPDPTLRCEMERHPERFRALLDSFESGPAQEPVGWELGLRLILDGLERLLEEPGALRLATA
jgi:AcrR family transcriptional regulator